MCGITGIINKNRNSVSKEIIKSMNDLIAHRGPDGEGFYFEENFAFGHRRLAIIDLSEDGHQPMTYLNRYVITYNGEIYNYIELKNELIAKGYEFYTKTDTEVILASYDYWGEDCLKKFNGMWAFVIYDKEKQIFFMSRDRFGVKPFYYYKDDEKFIFASEMKAILDYPNLQIKIDKNYLNSFLQNGPKEYKKYTLFENIYKFNISSYFKGSLDDIFANFTQYKFWELKPNLSTEKFDCKKAEIYAKKYYELLKDSVRIRLRADVKIGSALSGGLDSSSIVYLINEILKEQNKNELQETFSSVYKSTKSVAYCDESEFIDILARKLGVRSNQIEPKESEIPLEYQKMIYHMENPPESCCMSGWHTFKLVKSRNIKVTLDGQGADEQLGGYFIYIISYLVSLNIADLFKESFYCLKNMSGNLKAVMYGFLMSIFRNIFGFKILNTILDKVLNRKFRVINLNQQLANDTMQSLVTLIHYSDHIPMAYGVESRMPFMDYRLVEFLASIPAVYKLHSGWTKYIARLAFDKKLPDEIVWRKDKMGWPIPQDRWFRGNLKSWCQNTIKDSKILKPFYTPPHQANKELESKNINIFLRYLNIALVEKTILKGKKVA